MDFFSIHTQCVSTHINLELKKVKFISNDKNGIIKKIFIFLIKFFCFLNLIKLKKR